MSHVRLLQLISGWVPVLKAVLITFHSLREGALHYRSFVWLDGVHWSWTVLRMGVVAEHSEG